MNPGRQNRVVASRDDLAKCADRVMAFYRSLDERDYEGTAAQFHPDGGVFHRRGEEMRTREHILATMNKRSPTMLVVHVITNLELRQDPATCLVHGRCYLTVYRFDNGSPPPSPAPLQAPASLHESVMELRPHGDDWLLMSLRVHKALFESSPH